MKKIHYAGRVFDNTEKLNLIESALDFQLTDGKHIKQFEKELSSFLDVKYSLMVNSGSSANLLAFMTLTSYELGERRIKRGDEVITLATCFPTTVSPIINYGAMPVFVDVELETVNIDVTQLEKALSNKTKAVFIAHTLGNPFNIEKVQDFCIKYNLWLISDCCDSLGSTYKCKSLESYGDISTSSFYPAHHITTGQGGAVHTNNDLLYRIAKSFCCWGRDFKCNECKNDCEKRFINNYDCRYSYSHFGYNFQPTEMQASIGCSQLTKLKTFIEKRKENWIYLYTQLCLRDLNRYFIFQNSSSKSIVSPFSFLITLTNVCSNIMFYRTDITQYLEKNGIETRNLFAGNILRQECFRYLKRDIDYRIIGNLENTNHIMDNSFFIGCYPGLEKEDLDYIIEKIQEFIKEKENGHI